MKSHLAIVLNFTGLLALLAAGGCVTVNRPSSLTVPLEMRPTADQAGPLVVPGPALKVCIEPVDDNRASKTLIGENREEDYPVPIYAAETSPAQWLHDSMESQLRSAGMNIVSVPTEADRRVRLTLTDFWAEESPRYKAHITATAEVRDASGKILWTGVIRGHDETFGHSLSVENYQQVLSNSVVDCSRQLLANPGFGQSIAKTTD